MKPHSESIRNDDKKFPNSSHKGTKAQRPQRGKKKKILVRKRIGLLKNIAREQFANEVGDLHYSSVFAYQRYDVCAYRRYDVPL
jgi:hypothetical protein